MRVTKKQRRLAYELLQACATWCAERGQSIYIGLVSEVMLDDVDKFDRDEITLIAALAFRAADVSDSDSTAELWTEQYAEAAAMILEGWSPPNDA